MLYTQTGLPVFQNRMYDSAEAARAAPRGDMRLVEDGETGLVHNAAFEPWKVVYDAQYQNEQGHNAAFRDHLSRVAGIVEAGMGFDDLVEVGCGKGYFLEMLAARGARITGFEPTYEGDNPAIRKVYFDEAAGLAARGLILRHVLEHIPDPVAFLQGLARANGGGGLIYIEVPCFDWIAAHRAWFDIFYEHVNYFRLGDCDRMFGRIIDKGRVFGGQYLYVVADLASLRRPVRDATDPARLPDDFTATLAADTAAEGPSVIWGGASKGVIYSLLRAQAGHPVSAVIDINPAKQGRFLAATGLMVEAPEAVLQRLPEGARIVVMNSNYLPEIRDRAGDKFTCIGIEHD
ncbi:NDP-hexose methyltransferase [Allgaiera indica]|uniref:NDP-hexose methyltransferase n=1 Tax=Allgaiera indica TaxID=765699 RepID=A0AAN4UQP2_9RHOB|nr:NDP-hexose methyltransferase [Allgaiera indica]